MAEKLVIIEEFHDIIKAKLAESKLKYEGIKCFLSETHSFDLFGSSLGTIKLQVFESDAEKAIELLKESEDNQENP